MKKFNGLLALIIAISAMGIVAEARRPSKKKVAEMQCKDENPNATKKEIKDCVKEKLRK